MLFDFPGDTLHLSGVDIITGTPVLDIKPYIPDYDSPTTRTDDSNSQHSKTSFLDLQVAEDMELDEEPDILETSSKHFTERSPEKSISCPASASGFSQSGSKSRNDVLAEVKDYLKHEHVFSEKTAEDKNTDSPECSLGGPTPISSSRLSFGHELYSTIAAWVRTPPISNLDVQFTVNAEEQLKEFVPCNSTGTCYKHLRLYSTVFFSVILLFNSN